MAVLPHEGTYSVLYNTWPIPVGSHYRRGYITRPDQAGRFPTVIVVPDLGGLTSYEKEIARRLARRGIATVAVDMYSRRPESEDDALQLYHSLSDSEALRTIEETHQFLESEDITWAQTEKIGLLGLDVGGRFALIAASYRPWVGALAVMSMPFTGDEERRYQVADLLGHIPVATLGLYGEADGLIDTASVDEAQNRNPHGLWLLYESADHGFADIDSTDYDRSASEDALSRLIGFFAANLPDAEERELG